MKNRHPISKRKTPEKTLPLWQSVRDMLVALWNCFGGPETIAALSFLPREDFLRLNALLRGLEAMVRNLIFIDAAEIVLVLFGPKRKCVAAAARAAAAPEHSDRPETWRVSFPLKATPPKRSARASRPAPTGSCERLQLYNPMPLARRFEAVLRAFDAPQLLVKRAARILRRRGARWFEPAALPPWAGASILHDMKLVWDEAVGCNSS